ncbi:MAG: class I SAM-dependent methyltransferase [Cyanobacteria bacterium]|nr:class I SAM-dependent methyltransferase [Cyanobacteriota bacterium]
MVENQATVQNDTQDSTVSESLNSVEKIVLDLPTQRWEYVSPPLIAIYPDYCFPNMRVGHPELNPWPYLRKEIPHQWLCDPTENPQIGFVNRDEASILYNTALKFKGKAALEIGCWLGWSACHLALGGVNLDVVDPLLAHPHYHGLVTKSLTKAGVIQNTQLIPGTSPEWVDQLGLVQGKKWSLFFIDGDHTLPGVLKDTIACEAYAHSDALILFHDLASPQVGFALDYLKARGWSTMIYQTMQIMAVAWRGDIEPVTHCPDPKVSWHLPDHLKGYSVSGVEGPTVVLAETFEFEDLYTQVQPFTLLSKKRLYSLYSLAKDICLRGIPGDFVECGVYRGGSVSMLAAVVKRYSQQPRKVYAFDCFSDMPPPKSQDTHQGIPAMEVLGDLSCFEASPESYLNPLTQRLGVFEHVVPMVGLFSETFPDFVSKTPQIALLHADADWYDSTMEILEALYPCVVSQGVVQLDDYGYWEGCRKAVYDYQEKTRVGFDLKTIDGTGVWFRKSSETLSGEPSLQNSEGVMVQFIGDLSRQDVKVLKRFSKDATAILEFGVGGSTQILAQAAPHADIVSVDTKAEWIERTQSNFKLLGLEKQVHYVLWDDRTSVFNREYDFIFVDGWSPLRKEFLIDTWPLLKEGGMSLIHDTRIEPIQQIVTQFLQSVFNQLDVIYCNPEDSNLVVMVKGPLKEYTNWNFAEGKEAWEMGAVVPPEMLPDWFLEKRY